MKKLAILIAVAVMALAQDKGGPAPLAPGEVVRVVSVKNGDPNSIFNSLFRIFPGISLVGNNLIVRGQPAVVDTIEEAVKKLDVPPPETQPAKNVELTVQLVLGSAQELPDAKIPTDLESTVRQLRTLFPYKGYRVLDTEILRSRSDVRDLMVSGTLPGTQTIFDFRSQPSVNSGPAPRTIRLQHLQLNFRYEMKPGQYSSTGITTDIDVREGQKTVVGKANLVNSEDAIILVITPRIIE